MILPWPQGNIQYTALAVALIYVIGGIQVQIPFSDCHNIYRTRKNSPLLIPYSRKYWQELNLAVEPKIVITRILADLNLAVWYGIAICIHASRKLWRILIWRL